jgi:transcriptional regulator
MYLPERFKAKDDQAAFAVAKENPLATLISVVDGRPFVSHIPLILEGEGSQLKLVGHLAKANPHWKWIEQPLTAIFHGPNAYVTPRWYAKDDVPSWNYAVVHMTGVGRLLSGEDEIISCLKKLTAVTESKAAIPWEFWIPDDLASRLPAAIIGFEIEVQSMQAKFKLSQKASREDRAGIVQGLRAEGDERSEKIADLMAKDL